MTEYRTEEFYDKKKGRNVHSAFPDQVADDVNYESIPFSLEQQVQCISGENGPVRLRYHRWGTPAMSRDDKRPVPGILIKEQDDLFKALLDAPVMHVDGTAAGVNGSNNNVVVGRTASLL